MSAQIDYTTIALITIFTSLCTSIGKELVRSRLKRLHEKRLGTAK
jgi:hypothetical protein